MFQLRVNGEVVWKTDHQVEMVALQSSKGEAGRIGVPPSMGVVDIVVTEVPEAAPPRLDHVEEAQRQAVNDLIGEGASRGQIRPETYASDHSLTEGQGEHTYTATRQSVATQPNQGASSVDRDLASGINREDFDSDEEYSAALTARIEAFNESGDANAAVAGDDYQSTDTAAEGQAAAVEAQSEMSHGEAVNLNLGGSTEPDPNASGTDPEE